MSLTDDMLRLVHKATSRMRTQIGNMLGRAVVGAVNDGPGIQTVTVTVLAGESIDDVPHLQPGGLSHVSLPGSEGAVGCVGGSRDNPFAVGIANRGSRPTGLLPGETIIYAIGATGVTTIKLNLLGDIEITPSSLAPKVTVNGDVIATGEVTAQDGGSSVGLSTHLTDSPFGPLGPPTAGT